MLHINHGFLLQDQSTAPSKLCVIFRRETWSNIFLLNNRLTKRRNTKYPASCLSAAPQHKLCSCGELEWGPGLSKKELVFLIGNFLTKSVPEPSITRGVGTRGAADRQHLKSNHSPSMCPPQPLLSRQSCTHTRTHLKLGCSQHPSCQNTAAHRRLAGVVKPAQEVGQIF